MTPTAGLFKLEINQIGDKVGWDDLGTTLTSDPFQATDSTATTVIKPKKGIGSLCIMVLLPRLHPHDRLMVFMLAHVLVIPPNCCSTVRAQS